MTNLLLILLLLVGCVIGMIVNISIIGFGYFLFSIDIIPVPDGLFPYPQNNLHLFKFYHFIFPFLAHSIGTFVSVYFVCRYATNYKFILSLIISSFFLLGLLTSTKLAPNSYLIFDAVFAYFPMAYIAWKLNSND